MNKFLFLIVVSVVLSMDANAKYVRFSVDMTAQTIDSGGIHITGDFQAAAGYPGGDWQPNTTEMDSIGNMIYTVVVNIPAFAKYEYKFINGSGTYGLEFVPVESRVDDVFDDNRWIYIDSLGADTMNIGAILFSGNAPLGKYLLRVKVDMTNETLDAAGVHVQGSFNGYSNTETFMYSFGSNIHQYIAYVDSPSTNTYFKYVNGNVPANQELVPTACDFGNGYRGLNVTAHTVQDVVCFNSCSACVTGVNSLSNQNQLNISPNPFSDNCIVSFSDGSNFLSAQLFDLNGKKMQSFYISKNSFVIFKNEIPEGIYFLQLETVNGEFVYRKLIVQ